MMSSNKVNLPGSPFTFNFLKTATTDATSVGSNGLRLIRINGSRTHNCGNTFVFPQRERQQDAHVKIFKTEMRKERAQNKRLHNAQERYFRNLGVEYFHKIVTGFISQKRFLNYEERINLDLVIKYNFNKLCSPSTHVPNVSRLVGRWPTKLYQQLYFINFKNKCVRDNNARYQFNKLVKSFSCDNLYESLEIEAAPRQVIYDEDYGSDAVEPRLSSVVNTDDDDWYLPQVPVVLAEEVRERDPVLLGLLRLRLSEFARLRAVAYCRSKFDAILQRTYNYLTTLYPPSIDGDIELEELPLAQMEDPHAGEGGDVSEIKSENTLLTTHAEESVARPITITSDIWEQMCSGQEYRDYATLMSRQFLLYTGSWKTSDQMNHIVFDNILPKYLYDTYPNSPNAILFKQFSYFKCDSMDIRVVVNSSQFHCGQLQVSAYYSATQDAMYRDRVNIASASQMPHAIIDASSSNDAVFTIPYRYYKPLIGTTKTGDDETFLDICNLRVLVLSPLKLADDAAGDVGLNIYISFNKPSFHGMRSRKLAEAEMFSIREAVQLTAGALNQLYPDNQRDNPSDVMPPKPLVPWSAHSWCVGDVLPEPTNPLRMQAVGQTPHPPGTLPSEPECDIDYIKRVRGLVRAIKWDASNDTGTTLYSMPFTPAISMSRCMQKTCANPDPLTCFAYPPVGILSELFAQWRGSMEYLFWFVITKFHTGRLMIGYVPRYYAKSITNEELADCDYVTVDIRDNRQFTYTQHYISDRPWWPKRKVKSVMFEDYSPGTIYVNVLTPLTSGGKASANIDILLYMRGGEDLEFQVLTMPTMGLSFFTKVALLSRSVTYTPNYGPPGYEIYTSNWSGYTDWYIFRYGGGSGSLTQFELGKSNFGDVLQIKAEHNDKIAFPAGMPPLPKSQYYCNYLVLIPPNSIEGDTSNLIYGAPFPTVEDAKKFAETISWNKTLKKWTANFSYCVKYYNQTAGSVYQPTSIIFWDEVDKVVGEIDERNNDLAVNLSLHKPARSTGGGMLTYGESITNIKQIMRRYQPYAIAHVKDKGSVATDSDIICPILPQGVDLPLSTPGIVGYVNLARDGPIPILLSGYRFYRGGLRFRLLVASDLKLSVWIQHRPDYVPDKLELVIVPDDKDANMTKIFNPNYAYIIQSTGVNNIIEFSVPFYQPGQFGLLQRPNMKLSQDGSFYCMGSLCIGASTEEGGVNKSYSMVGTLMYSVDDDFSPSVFQGFPMVFPMDEYVRGLPRAQMEFDEFVGIGVQNVAGACASVIASDVEQRIPAVTGSAAADVADYINATVTKAKQKIEDEFKERVVSAMTAGDAGQSVIDAIFTTVLPEDKRMMVINILSQLVHCAINFNKKTVVWSIFSILANLGLIAYKYVARLITAATNYCIAFGIFSSRQAETEPREMPRAQIEEDVQAAFTSTCVASVLALFKLGTNRDALPKTLPDFTKFLYDGIPTYTRNANGLNTFFRNTMTMFKTIWTWCLSFAFPDNSLWIELSDEEGVTKLARQMQEVVDARNKDSIRMQPHLQMQVYELANVAEAIIAKSMMSTGLKPMPAFFQLCDRVIALRNELTNEMKSPPVRYEPFVVALCGESNIGKSFISERVSIELLKSIGYKTYAEPVYIRPSGNAYWNGLNGQPICVFDDFLAITSEQIGCQQIAELFSLKTTAVFNPPMAAIEQKNVRYNPLVVMMAMNNPSPTVPGVTYPKAWMRRRDELWEMRLKTTIGGVKYNGIHEIPEHVLEAMDHIEFRKYHDSSNMNSLRTEVYSYKNFLEYVTDSFKRYHTKELLKYNRRLQDLKALLPSAGERISSMCSLSDYITKYEEGVFNAMSDKDKQITLWARSKLRIGQMCGQATNHVANVVQRSGLLPDSLADKILPYVPTSFDMLPANRRLPEDFYTIENPVMVNQPVVHVEQLINYDEDSEEPAIAEGPVDDFIDSKITNEVKVAAAVHLSKLYPEVVPQLSEGQWMDEILQNAGPSKRVGPEDFPDWVDVEMLDGIADTKVMRMPCRCFAITLCDVYRKAETLAPKIAEHFPEGYFQSSWKEFVIGTSGCDHKKCLIKRIRSGTNEVEKDLRHKYQGLLCSHIATLGKKVNKENATVLFGLVDEYFKQYYVTHRKGLADEAVKECLSNSRSDSIMKKIWRRLPSFGAIWKMLKVIALLLIGVEALLRAKNWLLSGGDEAGVAEIPSSGASATVGKKGRAAPMVKKLIPVANAAPEQQVASTVKKIVRNTFNFVVSWKEGESEKSKRMRCVGLKDQFVLFLSHYKKFIDHIKSKTDEQIVYSVQIQGMITYLQERQLVYHCVENSEVMVLQLPRVIPPFKDILPLIADDRMATNYSPHMQLLELVQADDVNCMNVYMFDNVGYRTDLKLDDTVGGVNMISAVYTYNKSAPGLCGSLLIADFPTTTPILGVHIAGYASTNKGFAEVLQSSTFKSIYEMTKSQPTASSRELPFKEIDQCKLSFFDGVIPIGNAGKPVACSNKTRLQYTKCHGVFTPVTYDFPLLDPRDERIAAEPFSPLVEGCRKHGEVPINFDDNLVREVGVEFERRILTYVKPQRIEVGELSVENAIVGIKGLPEYEPLDFQTSEGYPWAQLRPASATDKKWLFDLEVESDGYVCHGVHPLLADVLKKRRDGRSKGEIQDVIFCDSLKDAKAPKEKACVKGKTRIFSMSPIDFTIQTRQLFMDYSVAYKCARFDNEAAVGVDVNSREWHGLAEHLLKNSSNVICGDYTSFGDKLMSNCVLEAFRIIIKWYLHNGDDNATNCMMRRCMAYEVTFAMHVMYDFVYQCVCGMPSGNPLTVILNSMVNSLYIRCAWQIIMRENRSPLYGMDAFSQNVCIVTYGDDIIMTVSDSAVDLFNAKSMEACFARHDIRFTDAAKSGNFAKCISITDEGATFLKCHFVWNDKAGAYLARLDKRSVEEIPNWCWSTSKDLVESSIEACKACLENAHGHGEEYYMALRSRMEDYWHGEGIMFTTPTWEEVFFRRYLSDV